MAAAHDFMESYELVCFAVTDPEAGANEVIAGAVHGGEPSPCAAVPYGTDATFSALQLWTGAMEA